MVWETTVRVETREDTTNGEPTVCVDGRGAWEEGRSWASLLGLRSNPLDLDNIAYDRDAVQGTGLAGGGMCVSVYLDNIACNRQGCCARNRFGWRVYMCV